MNIQIRNKHISLLQLQITTISKYTLTINRQWIVKSRPIRDWRMWPVRHFQPRWQPTTYFFNH